MATDLPHPLDDEPSLANEPPAASAPRSRRKNWRLRGLVALSALSFGLYVFVRLDRSTAGWLGPVGEGVHDLFNQEPGKAVPLSVTGRRFQDDVKALGGHPGVSVIKPGFLGTIGQEEVFNADFRDESFDDKALARLAESHGGRIQGLYLHATGVTDAGLKSLGKFTKLRHLYILNNPRRTRPGGQPVPPSRITDAGLVHLKGLDHLWTLNLGNVPITDVGLKAIRELPELNSLYLGNTDVRGVGLAGFKALSRLNILYLDGTKVDDEGLKVLAGATALQYLSLRGVPLGESALPLLKALPRVERLELGGCGFVDEEVDDLLKSKPGLKVDRR